MHAHHPTPTLRLLRSVALALVVVSWPLVGCVYSPLVKSSQMGAPTGLPEGEMEVGGSVSYFVDSDLYALEGSYRYGLIDSVALEAAVDYGPSWLIASAGARYTPWPLIGNEQRVSFLLDVELGGGGGVGIIGDTEYVEGEDGEVEISVDHPDWYDNAVYGGYLGVGLGVAFRVDDESDEYDYAYIDLFLRPRYQVSTSIGAGTTAWASIMLGVEHLVPWGRFYLSGGIMSISGGGVIFTEVFWGVPVIEAGFAFRF